MTDKEWNKIMEQKRKEASKPGYGARCAAKAKAAKTRGSRQELILS